MSKRVLIKIVCLSIMCLFCFTSQGMAASKIIIKFSAGNSATHPAVMALNEKFKPRLEELTKGNVEVQIFDNSQLGGERDQMEQLQSGVLHMAYISPVLGSIYPQMNILDLPFLFRDSAHIDAVIHGPIGEEILKDLPSVGLIPLGYFENGFRITTTSNRAINSLADMKGLKIRTPQAPLSIAIFNALGANPTPMSFTELYSAMQQGVVDGQENSYNTWVSGRFYEVQKHAAETNHMWGSFAILASASWWNRLDQATKDAIVQTCKETSIYQCELFRSLTAKSKKEAMDNGILVTAPDLTEFRKALQSVYEDFYKQYPNCKELVQKILAL